MPNPHRFQSLLERVDYGLRHALRNNRAADGGAFLPGLGRHFTHDFLDENRKFLHLHSYVRAENNAVERVSFHVEADCLFDNIGVALKFASCGC